MLGNDRVAGMSDMEANGVANGSAAARPPAELLTLDSLDKRTRAYRRYVAIRDAITGDLGGAEALSEVQCQMVSRFAFMAMQLEAMEAAAVQGDKVDLDLFSRTAGHMRRLGETLGITRKPRDVTPSLQDYIAQTYGKRGDAA